MVLREVSTVELSDAVQADLFEQVVFEMLDLREIDTCKKLMRTTKALRLLQTTQPDRYSAIESILQRGYIGQSEWPTGSKKKNRKKIAKAVVAEVSVVPPSRLLSIIGQALKWQRHMGLLAPGATYNLFRDKPPVPIREDEKSPSLQMDPITFAQGCRPICLAFSPDGQSLATGSTDGFVEIWNWLRSRLRTDLSYQVNDELMLHNGDVLCLAWSKDSELLASGDASGGVKIWHVSTGKCVRRFKSAHDKGVTSIVWSSDCSKIITSSLDGTVRLHGLRSGKTTKYFRGHGSYVHKCVYAGHGIASCSTDGTVKIWDKKTGDCQRTIQVSDFEESATGLAGGVKVNVAVVDLIVGRDKEGILVCNRTSSIFKIAVTGELQKRYAAKDEVEFVCAGLSSLGKYLYGFTSTGKVYAFDYETGAEDNSFQAHEKDITAASVHPHTNVVATCSFEQVLKMWKPE